MLRAQGIHSKVENDESIKGMVLRKVYPSHTDAKPTTVLHPDFEIIIKSVERTEVDLKAPVDLKATLPTWDKDVFREHDRLHLRGIVDVVRSIRNPMQFDRLWNGIQLIRMERQLSKSDRQSWRSRIMGLQIYELRPKPDCAICQSDADVCLYLRKDA